MNAAIKQFLREVAIKADGMSEGVDADGGYLVTSDIAKEIVDRIFTAPYYTYMASRYLVGKNANKISVPIDINPLQAAPSPKAARAYWQDEAAAITTTTPQLGTVLLSLSNLVVMIPATNELVEDVVNIDTTFIGWASKACQRKIASDMIFGTGGAIKGVGYGGDGTAATLTTAVDATPSDAQLKTMFGLLHPAAIPGAGWYVSHTVYQNLFTASGYTSIDKTYGRLTIMGLPVEINPYLVASPRHILLGNFGGYALAYKDPSLSRSLHIYYATNQQAFRLVMRLAGNAQTINSVCEDTVTRAYFVVPAAGGS